LELAWLWREGVRWCVAVCRGGCKVGVDGALDECEDGVCGAKMKNLMKAPIIKTTVSCPRKNPCVKVRLADMVVSWMAQPFKFVETDGALNKASCLC
jgi:hypothetical protein